MTFPPMSGGTGTVCGTTGSPEPVPEEPGSGAGPVIQATDRSSAFTWADWPLRSSLELGALPSAVPCARLHVRYVLWEGGMDALAEQVELIVSELGTNGAYASAEVTGSWYDGRWAPGRPPVRLFLCSDKTRVLVQVWDGNDREPEPRELDLEALGGRGLLLIEALSSQWGTYRPQRSSGKAVWAAIEK